MRVAAGSPEEAAKTVFITPEGKRPATPVTELKPSKGKRQKLSSAVSPEGIKLPAQQSGNGHLADPPPAQDPEGKLTKAVAGDV